MVRSSPFESLFRFDYDVSGLLSFSCINETNIIVLRLCSKRLVAVSIAYYLCGLILYMHLKRYKYFRGQMFGQPV